MRYITLFERESHENKSMQRDKYHKYKISKPKLNNLSSFFFFLKNAIKKIEMPFDQACTIMNSFDCLAFVPDEETKLVRKISTNLNKPSLHYKIVIFVIFKKK